LTRRVEISRLTGHAVCVCNLCINSCVTDRLDGGSTLMVGCGAKPTSRATGGVAVIGQRVTRGPPTTKFTSVVNTLLMVYVYDVALHGWRRGIHVHYSQ